MKIFIAKYALTEGILEYEVTEPSGDAKYVYVLRDGYSFQFKLDRDAFVKREDAVLEANRMVERKIASLRKSIARMEKLKFQ